MVRTFLTGRRASTWCLVAVLSCTVAGALWALEPKESSSYLSQKEFFLPELYISSSNEPLAAVLDKLPNKAAWEAFLADPQKVGRGELQVYVDPRSATAASVIGAFPLLPGDGVGNRVSLWYLSKQLGKQVKSVDRDTVAAAVLQWIGQNHAALGVDQTQLGDVRAEKVTDDLWHVSIPQRFQGVGVRYGRVAATISHGNLVLIGTETWGNVKGLSPRPQISAAEAETLGFAYAGGPSVMDEMVSAPALEVLPVAEEGGGLGQGYRHRLVWTFAFRRPPDDETWEITVDAHSGEVLAMQDVNQYSVEKISGGVYPLTSTEICPNADQCGVMQTGWPMPFANTGLAAPNNFTNSAGLFNYTSGTATTTLAGQFVRIADTCGAISNSAAGSINLGGTNGQHDCTTGGGSAGNTPASRTAFYEVNKLAEQARGWLPNNNWLKAQLTTNVNLNNTCNAFWNGLTINFYRSGGGCRNTGELAGVFDHEWGHGLDDNDTGGALSNSSEGYADIAAIYRLEASCVGHGFFWTSNKGCGMTADGTGFNADEDQTAGLHCNLDCSGVRDADWDKHADHTPDTALGFVCSACTTSTGPCGRQVHCAAAPVRQAAWDLVTRDLTAAPFNLDSQSAFIVGNKLFYQGSGNVGAWYSCTCGSSSSGCGSASGYLQWLAADDDNGNLNDGTPHMTAIFNAYNRHGIACSTPAPQNSGCSAGPSAAATLSATPGDNSVSLTWSSVAGATRYWVFRSEGHAGCNFGKTLIAEVTGTSYTDTQVGNGREYYYNVVAAGSSSACYGRASNCVNVTPAASTNPDFTLSCTPSSLSVAQGANGTSTCTVTSLNGFASAVNLSCVGQPAGVTCAFVPASPTPPANGSVNSTLTVSVSGSQPLGTVIFNAQGVSGAITKTSPITLTVTSAGGCTTQSLYSNDFDSASGLSDWTRGTFDGSSTNVWRGVQTCTAASGTRIFRFGGTGCTSNYSSARFIFAQPKGATGIAVPTGSTTARLEFKHRRQFETGFDGGLVALSLDGTNYTVVPASAIVSGASYNGTVAPDCAPAGSAGLPIYTGTQSTFVTSTIDLDAACNAASGGSGGCSGRTLFIGFTGITDCSVTQDGWFLDDVKVTACVP